MFSAREFSLITVFQDNHARKFRTVRIKLNKSYSV